MPYLTLIGLLAGCLTTIAFVPQVVRVWRTRSTTDISLGMFGLMSLGVFMWLVYGLMLGDIPIIAANAVTLLLATSIVIAKVRFG
ncbi:MULTISPECIES: SemiSWEET transporter [Kordiimonas]|uniref:MtN3 and saliva related transmembrane protein n=1 Tax=Kordiimonas lacus TaxID=637679 RepID=A0A1G7CLZ1_9PROT|nr:MULTISPECIES: SemiSWEET transporter [Kordiimonas]SDE40251.1 MtN3 and saliva related transmembrane protein [Kordiimonas lacus]